MEQSDWLGLYCLKSDLSPPRSGEGPWIGRKIFLPDAPQADQPELRLPSAVGDVSAPVPAASINPSTRCWNHDDLDNATDNGGDSVRGAKCDYFW